MYLEPIACIDLNDLMSSPDIEQIIQCISDKKFVVVLCTKNIQNHKFIEVKYKRDFVTYIEADKLAKTYINDSDKWYELISFIPWHKLNMMIELGKLIEQQKVVYANLPIFEAFKDAENI